MLALALGGCGKKKADEEPAAVPEVAPVAAAADTPATVEPPAEAAAEAAAAPAASAEATACAGLLDKAWPHVEAVLGRLGVEDAAALAGAYKSGGTQFIERCAALTEEQRACLAAAEHPIEAIATCKINEGKKASERLFGIDMGSHVKMFEPGEIAEDEAQKVVSELSGRWVSNWAALKTQTTWVVADGVATIDAVANGKAQDPKTATLSLTKDRRLTLTQGTSAQPYAFLRDGGKTFYLSSNLLYDAYPVTDATSFKLRNDWDFVVFDNGACEAMSATGVVAKATCKFGKRDGGKTFEVAYQFPGEVWNNGKPAIKERTYFLVGDHFLHESMVTIGTFKKK